VFPKKNHLNENEKVIFLDQRRAIVALALA
jgi:hypothetical protein